MSHMTLVPGFVGHVTFYKHDLFLPLSSESQPSPRSPSPSNRDVLPPPDPQGSWDFFVDVVVVGCSILKSIHPLGKILKSVPQGE